MKRMKINEEGARKQFARDIATAPGYLLPREFTQNGIDNAIPGKPVEIEWFAYKRPGFSDKLAVADNASGMSLKEFRAFCSEMASSFGEKDASKNHGVGARLIGLHSNPEGLIYFTRHKGGPTYMAILKLDDVGFPVCQMEPHQVPHRREIKGESGTMVIFLGKNAADDTLRLPWKGAALAQNELSSVLTRRYFRFPENVSVRLSSDVSPDGYRNRVAPLSSLFEKDGQKKYEGVASANWIIHYLLMPAADAPLPRWRVGTLYTRSFAAVAMDGEVYSSIEGNDWPREAMYLDIDEIADRAIIVVEVKRELGVTPKTDRSALSWDEPQHERPGYSSRRKEVFVRNFAKEIRAHMPQWMRDAVEKQRTQSEVDDKKRAKQTLRDMARQLDAYRTGSILDPKGEDGFGKLISPVFGQRDRDGKRSRADNPSPEESTEKGDGKGKVRRITANVDVKFHTGRQIEWIRLALPFDGQDSAMMSINEDEPKMKNLFKQVVREIGEDAAGKFWESEAPNAAMITFGKHYLNMVQLMRNGHEEAAEVLGDGVGLLSAFSHFLEFSNEIIRRVKVIKAANKKRLELVG